jgi:hypothetical protein
MIWLFERGQEDLRIETQYDNVSGEYLLTLRHPDASYTVERFPNTQMLEARLETLEDVLVSDRWSSRNPQQRLKDTWRL